MDMVNKPEVITKIATNLIEDSIKCAWDKVKKFFKDIDAKDAIRYQTAYENYLDNTCHRNSKIKTIIYRRAPKDLYSFYECIGVEYYGDTINTDKITNLFELGNKIIITGTGGVGKSILFKHLFLNTVAETSYIPVLIELRSFNILDLKDISLYNSIFKNLSDNGFELSMEYFEYSMKEGGYIIFLDGYDEVNRDKVEKITSEIKSLTDKYTNNKYYLSSRPCEAFIGWNDFCEVQTLPLSKEQALGLISKIDFDEKAKETFYKELDDHLYDDYRSFASNPLLLNIMLLTFQKHASIPERLNDFYEEAFVTLFNVHDATKDSYVRDIRSGLGCEDFKHVFAYLCFKSYFSGEFEFSESRLRDYLQQAKEKLTRIRFSIEDIIEDLTMSVCMLVKEGLVYRFSHRSFQEYFAAWYTCKLTDDVQAKLLASWIKESDSIFSDSYFQMLFDLQSDKFNKIVLCPILNEVSHLYSKYGFSLDLLNTLFEGITLNKKNIGTNDYQYSTSLTIVNEYLCYGMKLNNRLNAYPYGRTEEGAQKEKKLYEKTLDYLKKTNDERYKQSTHLSMTFDEMLKIVSVEELLDCLGWFEKQILFAITILDECSESNISRKKKVSSILEEL